MTRLRIVSLFATLHLTSLLTVNSRAQEPAPSPNQPLGATMTGAPPYSTHEERREDVALATVSPAFASGVAVRLASRAGGFLCGFYRPSVPVRSCSVSASGVSKGVGLSGLSPGVDILRTIVKMLTTVGGCRWWLYSADTNLARPGGPTCIPSAPRASSL